MLARPGDRGSKGSKIDSAPEFIRPQGDPKKSQKDKEKKEKRIKSRKILLIFY